jgi:hypothetical protein
MVWQVLVPGMHTVTVANTTFVEVKDEGAGPASTTMGATFAPVVVGLTMTVAVPDTVVFWVEVAVTVTRKEALVPGAVKSPVEEIDPELAAQVTALLKLPVPVTVAVH